MCKEGQEVRAEGRVIIRDTRCLIFAVFLLLGLQRAMAGAHFPYARELNMSYQQDSPLAVRFPSMGRWKGVAATEDGGTGPIRAGGARMPSRNANATSSVSRSTPPPSVWESFWSTARR